MLKKYNTAPFRILLPDHWRIQGGPRMRTPSSRLNFLTFFGTKNFQIISWRPRPLGLELYLREILDPSLQINVSLRSILYTVADIFEKISRRLAAE